MFDHVSTWLLSLIATIALPLLPLAIEYLKTGAVGHETYYLACTILASTLLFTAEHNFFRSGYIVLLVSSLLLDLIAPARGLPSDLAAFSWIFVAAVATLHTIERFLWHVIDDRPFPQ